MSGDPLLPQDAPTTPEEWQREWRVLLERMRQEPDLWVAKRWSLHEWDYEPSFEFVKEFLTLWYQAGATYGALDKRTSEMEDELGIPGVIGRPEAHPQYQRALRAIDVLVSAEKSRRIREQIAATGASAAPEPLATSSPVSSKPGPDPAKLVTRAKIEAKRAELAEKGKPHGYDSLARALGVHRDTIRRRLKGGGTPN